MKGYSSVQETARRWGTILSFEPKKRKKKRMVSCIRENHENEAEVFIGFKRTMNSIHARADEIILSEYVYCQRKSSGQSLIGPSAAFCCPAMTY